MKKDKDIYDPGFKIVGFDWARFHAIPNYVPPTSKPMPLPAGEHLTKTPSAKFKKHRRESIWNRRYGLGPKARKAA